MYPEKCRPIPGILYIDDFLRVTAEIAATVKA